MSQPSIKRIIESLRSAAAPLPADLGGVLAVRQEPAARIIGCAGVVLHRQTAVGKISRLRIRVEPSMEAPHGVRVMIPLTDLERFARRWRRRPARRIVSEADRRKLRRLTGLHTRAEIAEALGRSVHAVDHLISEEGGLFRILQQEHGLVRVHDFAHMVRRDRANVRNWIVSGMPALRRPGRQRQYLIRLPEARAWMATRPALLVQLHPEVRRMLKLRPADLETMTRGAAA